MPVVISFTLLWLIKVYRTTYCVRERETDSLFTRNVFWPVSSILPTNEVCEGYVFYTCQSFCSQGGGGERGLHPEGVLHWGGLHCGGSASGGSASRRGSASGGRGFCIQGGWEDPPSHTVGEFASRMGVCIKEGACIQERSAYRRGVTGYYNIRSTSGR